MARRRYDNSHDASLVSDLLHLSLRWPPAGLIAAAGFGLAGFVARYTIRSDFGGSFAGEMIAIPLYLLGGFCFVFFLVGAVMWLVRRATGAAAPASPRSPNAAPHAGSLPPGAPAPLCARCGVPMVRRVAGRGLRAGRPFWGCRNFPACRQVRSIG
jgi:hypothetical protein